ncbi:MAG: hypothetical protein IPK16_00760 [Anaerolineales bacterium]|nr:hypothetical protein [Anaerolineales bacterium]
MHSEQHIRLGRAQFDLSAYAGKSVTVDFRVKNTGPSPANSNFFVDDVRLISGACTQASDLDNLVELAPLDDLDGVRRPEQCNPGRSRQTALGLAATVTPRYISSTRQPRLRAGGWNSLHALP